MTENQPQQVDNPIVKFHSKKGIGLATFLGGPVAAGILIRKNYLNLDKTDQANHALFIGILSTVVVLAVAVSIPEGSYDKLLGYAIPAAYTAVVYFLVDKYQGETLQQHEDANGEFYSRWRAAGIGLVGGICMLIAVFGYAFAITESFDDEAYDARIEIFNENEIKAMKLYEYLEQGKLKVIPPFIIEFGMPAWNENLRILNQLDNMPEIYPELKAQNEMLRKYCNLRIEVYQLIGKAINEDTNEYDYQIEQLHYEIDKLLNE